MTRVSTILFLVGILLSFDLPLHADEIEIGYGFEELKYKEKEDIWNIESNATVSNTMLSIQYERGTYLRFPQIFWGIKVKFPITKGGTTENWDLNGDVFQSNTLKYGWLRGDLYLGFPSHDLVKPYIGLRWYNAKQERSDFFIEGVGNMTATVKEDIAGLGFLFGIKGENGFVNFDFGYHLGYVYQPENRVENNYIAPDYDLSSEGYTYELGIDSEYRLYKGLHLGINGYLGKTHWEGSDWEWTECSWSANGQGWCRWVKWPENTTDYLGGYISLQYKF